MSEIATQMGAPSFRIRKQNIPTILEALRWHILHENAGSIQEAFEEMDWYVDTDRSGDIAYIAFTGEYLGHEEEMFSLIAPYVESGSFIQMRDENDEVWRWIFHDGRVYYARAVMSFPDEVPIYYDEVRQ